MTEVVLDTDRLAFVSALDLPPDAVLVVKSQRRLTLDMAEMLREQFAEKFPGREILVLPPDLDLDVVREVHD